MIRSVGESVAGQYGMHPAPGENDSIAIDGEEVEVLGYYIRHRPRSGSATGSDAYLALFVFAEKHKGLIRLFDYSNGQETEFGAGLRRAIEERLRQAGFSHGLEVSKEVVWVLPP